MWILEKYVRSHKFYKILQTLCSTEIQTFYISHIYFRCKNFLLLVEGVKIFVCLSI